MSKLDEIKYNSHIEFEKYWCKVELDFLWWAWDPEKWVNLTGSATKLTINFPDGRKYIWLIDFGMFQWCENALKYNEVLPFKLEDIDFVIATHTHLDHIGKMLHFSKDEFNGKIITTSINAKVMMIMLKDIIKLQQLEEEKNITPLKKLKNKVKNLKNLKIPRSKWDDADVDDFDNLISELEDKLSSIQSEDNEEQKTKEFFSSKDLNKLLLKINSSDYYEKTEVKNDIELVFIPAWHLPGSSQAIIKIKVGKNKFITLWFSGDLWKIKNPAVWWKPEVSKEKFDLYMIESTYAWRFHPEIQKEENKFIEAVNHAISNNWKIIIPVFMQWRAQEVALYIHKLQKEWKIPNIPIFYHSDSIWQINNIYKNHYPKIFKKLDKILKPAVEQKWRDKKYIFENYNKPAFLLASWWMVSWWTIMSYLWELTDKNNSFIAVWYQAEDSLGNEIFTQKKDKIKYEWTEYSINAKIEKVSLFSWHADEEDLIKIIKKMKFTKDAKIIINHWEKSPAQFVFGLALKQIVGKTKDVLFADFEENNYPKNK